MTKCFEDNIECTELVLHIVMDKPNLVVKEARSQYGIKNLQGRSVRLDVLAIDRDGKKYNVEVQKDDQQAGPKRARYNSSLIDANAILPGEDVEQLPETYVILFTDNDYLKKGKPIYHIKKYVEESKEIFDDGSYTIYVNGTYKGDSPLGKLIHDFNCTNPADMNYLELADRVRYFKEDKEGLGKMCKAMEELIHEEIYERNIRLTDKLLKNGHSLQEVADYLEISVEEAEELAESRR